VKLYTYQYCSSEKINGCSLTQEYEEIYHSRKFCFKMLLKYKLFALMNTLTTSDSVALLVNSKVMVKTYPSVDPLHMPTDICSFLYRRQRFTENATEPVKEEA
jgi:hypothetical protein